MKTLQQLAEHLSGRISWMPEEPLPDADKLPADSAGMYALVRERETACCDSLDRKIRENLSEVKQSPLDRWENWFLLQRWRCAAMSIERLATSLPKPTFLRLSPTVSEEALMEWCLILLWHQQKDLWLQDCVLRLSLR